MSLTTQEGRNGKLIVFIGWLLRVALELELVQVEQIVEAAELRPSMVRRARQVLAGWRFVFTAHANSGQALQKYPSFFFDDLFGNGCQSGFAVRQFVSEQWPGTHQQLASAPIDGPPPAEWRLI